MKVLVLGATGGTGRALLPKLLEQGHEVTAFARVPAAVTAQHERLTVVRGEARDAASVDHAVKGHDAVVCAVGPRPVFHQGDLQETLMKHLVAAMERHRVKRLVNLSGWGAGTSAATAPLPVRLIGRPFLLKHFFADKERGETVMFGSGLEWVNPRPGRLNDERARGGVRASADGRGLSSGISRTDVAEFLVAQLQSDEWLRKSPIIGYPETRSG